MILISVKYYGATNHRGSKWVATMADSDGSKLRASEPYAYGDSNGSMGAALKVLAKWDDMADFTARVSDGDWEVTEIGTTHDHNLIFTAVVRYEGE